MTREEAVSFLLNNPYKFAQMVGFKDMRPLHNEWIKEMIMGKTDKTLQASRGTYKTTSVSIALSLIIILLPNCKTMFMRKTDEDIKEVIKQVQKILLDAHTRYFVEIIYGVQLKLTVQSATEISTNLRTDIKGTNQLVGTGMGSSLTGKHFDRIFTDDIVNVNDRISKAERERTKLIYQELQNVKNRGGRIFNTGTPWHVDDCFSIMPDAIKYDCYNKEVREIITEEELNNIKTKMLPSLFAANYELRHIASENVIFPEPEEWASIENIKGGIAHLDSAFYGDDFTAFSIMTKHEGKYYLYGKVWRKNVDDCYHDIVKLYNDNLCPKLYNELNADKGLVAKQLRNLGVKVSTYNESMNKYMKIVTYLKAIWPDIVIVEGTDDDYLDMILDYTEDADHDDAPDSAACLARLLYKPVVNTEDAPRPYLL